MLSLLLLTEFLFGDASVFGEPWTKYFTPILLFQVFVAHFELSSRKLDLENAFLAAPILSGKVKLFDSSRKDSGLHYC